MSIKNKVAVITGGSSGIGKAISDHFIKHGAIVICFDQKAEDEVLSADNKLVLENLKVDITDKTNVDNAVDKVINKYGKIDILVNSAGIALLESAEALSEEYWDITMNVNLKGSFLTAQAVGKHMITQKSGSIINIASQAGIVAFDRHLAYTASKAGVIGMTKVMALEWAEFNVRVNAISPTIIMTELGKKAWAGPVGDAMMQQIPMKRFGNPEEIAGCALFLADEASSLVTGSNLVADGGYTIK